MPKLQKLLSVFREFANSQYEGKEHSADCFIYETYLFISLVETKTEDEQSGYFCISYHSLTLSLLRSLLIVCQTIVWEIEGSSPRLLTDSQGLRITKDCAAFAMMSANG